MKVLLLGMNGQLGSALKARLAGDFELVVASRAECDLSDPGSVGPFVDAVKPDAIVNAAAWTAVDLAEKETVAAFTVNARSVEELAKAAVRNDTFLLHYSTDYVFDGTATEPYCEDDPVAPANAYGRSKLAGEEAIRASGCRYLILRTAWVYGPVGKNFFLTILRLAGEREELGIVADQIGCPTSTLWLADATAQILPKAAPPEAKTRALANAVCAGQCSWFDFANAIVDGAKARGKSLACQTIKPIATADYPTPAARPAYSVLDTTRLSRDWGVAPPGWRDALAGVLDHPG